MLRGRLVISKLGLMMGSSSAWAAGSCARNSTAAFAAMMIESLWRTSDLMLIVLSMLLNDASVVTVARCALSRLSLPCCVRFGHMLIKKNRIPVGIDQHRACRPGGGFVGFERQRQPSTLERPLKVAHIIEIRQGVGGSVPSRVERERVLGEHALEKADRCGLVLQDQPVFRLIAADRSKAELFVERSRCANVLDGETDGEIAELHVTVSRPCGSIGC